MKKQKFKKMFIPPEIVYEIALYVTYKELQKFLLLSKEINNYLETRNFWEHNRFIEEKTGNRPGNGSISRDACRVEAAIPRSLCGDPQWRVGRSRF